MGLNQASCAEGCKTDPQHNAPTNMFTCGSCVLWDGGLFLTSVSSPEFWKSYSFDHTKGWFVSWNVLWANKIFAHKTFQNQKCVRSYWRMFASYFKLPSVAQLPHSWANFSLHSNSIIDWVDWRCGVGAAQTNLIFFFSYLIRFEVFSLCREAIF